MRTRQPLPVANVDGIVQTMAEGVVAVSVPTVSGLAKLPEAFDNSTSYTFALGLFAKGQEDCVNVTVNVSPLQKELVLTVGELILIEKKVRSAPLSEPNTGGLLLITRMRYKLLVTKVDGNVHEIVPLVVDDIVPTVTGVPPKLPTGSEICAEKTLAAGELEKVPDTV